MHPSNACEKPWKTNICSKPFRTDSTPLTWGGRVWVRLGCATRCCPLGDTPKTHLKLPKLLILVVISLNYGCPGRKFQTPAIELLTLHSAVGKFLDSVSWIYFGLEMLLIDTFFWASNVLAHLMDLMMENDYSGEIVWALKDQHFGM